MSRTRLGVALAALALVSACGTSSTAGSSGAGNTYAGKTLQLGAVVSKTGAGSVYGLQQVDGVQLAQDYINSHGGVLGAQIAVDVVDDGSDKSQGAQQFQTEIQQKNVLGIIGPTLSNTAVAAHPVANNLKTPVIAPSNTGINIVGSCPYACDYIFRDSLGEESAIPANVKQAIGAHHPKAPVLFYVNDDKFSSDGHTIFLKSFQSDGVAIPDANVFGFSKNDPCCESVVTSALAKSPDIVSISSLGAIPAKLIHELRKQGYKGTILGGNGFNTYQVSQQAGSDGLGAQSGSAYYVGIDTQINKDFVAAYQAKFGQKPDQIAAQAYAAVFIFAEAAKKANLELSSSSLAADRTKLRDALKSVSVNTPFGQFSFTATHDVKQTIYVVAMDGSGGFSLVSTVQP